jgi:uncharacterized protein (DUF1800 family)
MALDLKAQAALAFSRFGLGPRATGYAKIASDPRGAVLAELENPGAARIEDGGLLGGGPSARAFIEYRRQRVALQRAKARAAAAGKDGAADAKAAAKPAAASGGMMRVTPASEPGPARSDKQAYYDEAKLRFTAATEAEIGFVERLVWFWSNHFCVSVNKSGVVRSMAGAFEREAIRAHALARFRDMLLAVEQHPAMLFYLDNVKSFGPNSRAGKRRSRGFNENLAREIMELHTLGVRTVYTQTDVIGLAKTITGWTIVPFRSDPARGGEFHFDPRMHEPGAQTVLGRRYRESGVEQGRAALLDIAAHPATARHIATKLAAHFVADQPPPSLVERLERRYLDTNGDLKEVAKALVTAPEAWSETRGKLRRPAEWIAGCVRMCGVPLPETPFIIRFLALLGEPLWRPPAPKGFPDDNDAWLDGLPQRLRIANRFGHQFARIDAREIAEKAFGPLLSEPTRQTLRRAESKSQALALLLMSPEVQRR